MSKRSNKAWFLLALTVAGCGSAPSKPEKQAGVAPLVVKERSTREYAAALEKMRAHQYGEAEPMLVKLTQEEPTASGPWANLGVIYRERGDTEAAEKAFKRAVEINPKNGAALNELGVIARARGDFLTAEASYQQCVKAQPDNAACYLNLGILYELYLGRFGDALDAYRTFQSLSVAPDERVQGWVSDLERRLVAGS
jgi:Flp pilus assembly protein TadD